MCMPADRKNVRAGFLLPALALVLWGIASQPACAQADSTAADSLAYRYGSGYGGEIVLTNSGFGLGGYLSERVGTVTSVVAETHLVAGKDPREAAFFDLFGRRSIPEKANYFLMMPFRVGVQRWVLRPYIEENFRPYVHVSVGPAFGWAYPYFEDANDNQSLDDGERIYGTFSALAHGDPRLGIGALIAVGAHFGTGRATRSLRIGYDLNYFFDAVQLLEPDVKDAQHYFGTPTISLTFGRLF